MVTVGVGIVVVVIVVVIVIVVVMMITFIAVIMVTTSVQVGDICPDAEAKACQGHKDQHGSLNKDRKINHCQRR